MTHWVPVRRGMVLGFFVALLAGLVAIPAGVLLQAADHRDAPLIDEDPSADINDVFVFVNPNDPTKVIFAMSVNGFAVPAVRSSYSFAPEALYQFKIDNTGDAREDLVIQATFDGFESLRDPRCPAPAGGQFVTIVGPAKPVNGGADNFLVKRGPKVEGCTNTVLSNDGIRAFAALSDDPFVVDIGQFNRILGGTQDVFRQNGAFRGRALHADGTSGVNGFGGFNASVLVVEVPIALIQGRANRAGTYLANDTTIGVWGTTGRGKMRKHPGRDDDDNDGGRFTQVQRMGHQLFKTVFLPTAVKDAFNASTPTDDARRVAQFIPDALTSNDPNGNTIAARAALLTALGFTTLPDGAPLLLGDTFTNTDKELLRHVLIPDVLRFNLAAPAKDVGVASNGLQNGRRFGDDVVDILLRLARELADVKFPDGSGLPGSNPLGTRRALDCDFVTTPPPAGVNRGPVPCPDRRVLAVIQGTDFIEPDAFVTDVSDSGNDRPFRADFPFIGTPHPLPGEPGTVGFPPQQ
ncbi:MAG TPA: DUF4331 family protein [Patescibacteria group bacterium]|nr:DUF4331 family protein [Patescibacteria group bacterium]